MSETWKPFPGFESDYEVSNLGRVRHARSLEVRSNAKNDSGMHILNLYSNGRNHMVYVHIAVCTAFNGPPPFDGAKCLHWDDDHDNNKATNLRWGTLKENQADLKRNGKTTGHRGELNGKAKLTADAVREIRNLRKRGKSPKELSEMFGISSATISNICAFRLWRHIA